MGASNDEWSEYSSDTEATRRWDEYVALPDLPVNDPRLQRFLDSKGLQREDLMRVGAKWGNVGGHAALVYMFHSWRKYRVLATGARSSDPGASWPRMKIVRSTQPSSPDGLIIAEGETDGALLTRIAPQYDIGILPAGAKHFTPDMAEQCAPYKRVLVALDNDAAGNEGAAAILAVVQHSERLLPPGDANDWCDANVKGLIVDPFTPTPIPRPRIPVFTLRELMDAALGTVADNSWFNDPIAPVGGEVVIHGPMKSLKSVLLMELLRAISTGTDFAGYIPFARSGGAGRVLLFQFEVPPQPFQRRIAGMLRTMGEEEAELFTSNVNVYKIASGQLPRLRITHQGFREEILAAVDAADADVVAFDPVQRMAGGADINLPHELELVFALYETLMDAGKTVIYTHHNNKVSRNEASAYSMSGTQRFGADADAICSVYHSKDMVPDDNIAGERQRNFRWDLRNGVANSRSMLARPWEHDPSFMVVQYSEPVTASAAKPAPVVTSDNASSRLPAII